MSADTQAILADLLRVKVIFQARTIAAVIGAPLPTPLPLSPHLQDRDDA